MYIYIYIYAYIYSFIYKIYDIQNVNCDHDFHNNNWLMG